MSEFRRKLMINATKGGGEDWTYKLLDNTEYNGTTHVFSKKEDKVCLICKITNSFQIQSTLRSYIDYLCELDSEGEYIDFWGSPANRTINLTGKFRTKYLVCTLGKLKREYNELKDLTNDKILFSGFTPYPEINRVIDNTLIITRDRYVLYDRNTRYKSVFLFPIHNSDKITWGTITRKGSTGIYEADYNYKEIDSWGAQANPRTVNLTGKSNTKYLATSFENAEFDNGYIYDETNKIYIYKGKNVK